MKFILGTKEKMTQVFDEAGIAHAVTLLSATPLTVLQLKSKAKDGYEAVQVGYGTKKEARVKKPQKGHFKGNGFFQYVREFPAGDPDQYKVGDKIEIDTLNVGEKVEISGISKGKGFQGVVKRHGFKGGRRSHGQKHSEREAGSIGGGGRAGGRVTKGMRMAGRMGSDRITVKNLKVMAIDKANNLIVVRGAIPGRKGTLVEIKAK